MLNTEPMFNNNESTAKQFGAAFAATHPGQLLFFILLFSAGITFIVSEFGVEKLGRVFVITAVLLIATDIITRVILRKFFVTVLLSDSTGLAGKNYINFLIQVSGGIVKAVSATALWGKEGMLCLRVPLQENCFLGFPVMTMEKAPLIVPIRHVGFLDSVQIPPVKWQSLYDLAAVNGNMASVGDGLRKRFDEESLKHRLDWFPLVVDFLDGKITPEQFKLQLGLVIIEWNLCPFAQIELAIETPIIRIKHQVILT